jgi:hypothetical protein
VECQCFLIGFSVQADKFILQYEDDDEPYVWEGEDVQTVDGIKHLYGIGAYSHIWDEVDSDDKRYLAQTINDFLYDYDPYEYRDAFDDEDEVIEALITQFADINDFAKAHAIMNNALLEPDQIYTQLGEFLQI